MGPLGKGPDAGRAVSAVSQVLKPGDVIYVEPSPARTASIACTRSPRSKALWW